MPPTRTAATMDNLCQSDISLNFIISPSENAILFALAKVQIEHGSCPKLDRTLERSGQCAGVERLRDGRQLCLKFFMRMESGHQIGKHQTEGLI